MGHAMLPALETPRLRLRPLAAADLPDLIALDLDPEVMRYVGSPAGVKTPAETEARARARILEVERGVNEPLGFWRVEARGGRAGRARSALRGPPAAGRGDLPGESGLPGCSRQAGLRAPGARRVQGRADHLPRADPRGVERTRPSPRLTLFRPPRH